MFANALRGDPSWRTLSQDIQPLVSVVTPFYNTEAYLAECIESVLNQSYRNWEYLLVDNCSTDASASIAAHYARGDPRIHLIPYSEFVAQIPNYNRALQQISPRSRYCKVVQADDWLFPDCLMRMVALAEAYPTVGVVSSYRIAGDSVSLRRLPYPVHFMTGADVCRLFFLDDINLFGSPTSLLIRSDLVRRRPSFYDESAWLIPDTEVCLDLLQCSDFAFVHQVLTFTRRNNSGSITASRKNFHPGPIEYLIALRKFGTKFLDLREYNRCLANAEQEYYLLLARCLWSRWGCKEFWQFYKRGLADAGGSLNWPRILTYAVLVGLWDLSRAAGGLLKQTVLTALRTTASAVRVSWGKLLLHHSNM
ncbi:MAG: glycosyltransferase family 2 protein [Acidobacteria bacterium]|nr:glycosyltransferase family 2 protein [Acidobacteriota bacterium]